jgi:hypothetical protein
MLLRRVLNRKFYCFLAPAVKEIKSCAYKTSHCDISSYRAGITAKAGSQSDR